MRKPTNSELVSCPENEHHPAPGPISQNFLRGLIDYLSPPRLGPSK